VKFSLIAVTTDRLHLADRLFASLVAQTHKSFEVIFVHGKDCTTEAQALVSSYAANLDIKTVVSADNCLSRSRNLALPLVSGDIVAFPDDDCVYEPNTLLQCVGVFSSLPQVHVLAARMLDFGEVIAPPATAVQELNRVSVFRHSFSTVQFHKLECVKAVGGFDEDLGVGSATPYQSGEDTDYMLRSLKSGFCLAYAPSIIVRHSTVNLRDPALPEKVKAYARGRMRLLRKHDMPTWFIIANIVYPLARMPVECLWWCARAARYRWNMFRARLAAYRQGVDA